MANPGSFRDLTVYKKAFEFAMRIFNVTKEFPSEEKYELTDQIRRSSRAICRAIGEGYRKRQYPRHFASKISDADSENTETQVSLDFAMNCTCRQGRRHCHPRLLRQPGGGPGARPARDGAGRPDPRGHPARRGGRGGVARPAGREARPRANDAAGNRRRGDAHRFAAAGGGGSAGRRCGGSPGRSFSITQEGPSSSSFQIRCQRKPARSQARTPASFLTGTTAQQATASVVVKTSSASSSRAVASRPRPRWLSSAMKRSISQVPGASPSGRSCDHSPISTACA